MSFTSLEFIFIFLPITLGIHIFLSKRYPAAAPGFLLLASLLFCGLADLRALIVLVVSTLINYALSIAIQSAEKPGKRRLFWMITGISFNVIVLFCFKFFTGAISELVVTTVVDDNAFVKVGVPLGISFYTLYQISHLIDIYQSKALKLDITRYGLSVAMFAQLPAGPIYVYKDAVTQFQRIGKERVKKPMLNAGLSLFTIGLYKKVLIGEPLAILIDQLYASANNGGTLTPLESLAATWGFLLQLYFDFSAYSDMAIGLGLCFGLQFPINFNSPLKARSFGEYIMRWHISLIVFTRDYIFLPVSRIVRKMVKGSSVKRQLFGWILGTQVAYLTINAWHSPTLTFLAYGVIVGGLIIVTQVATLWLNKSGKQQQKGSWLAERAEFTLKRFMVLGVASIIVTSLRAENFSVISSIVEGFANFQSHGESSQGILQRLFLAAGPEGLFPSVSEPMTLFAYRTLGLPPLPTLVILTLAVLYGPNTMEVFGLVHVGSGKWYHGIRWKPNLICGLIIGVLLTCYLMFSGDRGAEEFIYARF